MPRHRISALVLSGVMLAACGTASTTSQRQVSVLPGQHLGQVAHLRLDLARAEGACGALRSFSRGETRVQRSALEKNAVMLGSNATIAYVRIAAIDLRRAERAGSRPRVSAALRRFTQACSAVSRLARSLDL